jgi:hypothetical protein
MKVRFTTFLVLLLIAPVCFAGGSNAYGDTQRTILYQGTARIITLSDGSEAREQVLLKKIYSPKASILTEIACFKGYGKPAALSPVFMKVNGNTMRISDKADFNPGKISGSGELQGPNWDWTYLKWSMQYQMPGGLATVEDANFVVGNQLIGRKQMLFNGRPFQLWDIEMTELTRSDFDLQVKALGCPAF